MDRILTSEPQNESVLYTHGALTIPTGLARFGLFHPMLQWHFAFPVYHTAIQYCHSAFCTDVIFPLVRPVTFYLQRISKNDKLMLCNAGGVESILQSIDCMCFISCLTYCTLLCMWAYYKIAIFIIIAVFVTKSSYMYCLGLIDLLFHQSAGWLASAWTGPLWIFRVFLL